MDKINIRKAKISDLNKCNRLFYEYAKYEDKLAGIKTSYSLKDDIKESKMWIQDKGFFTIILEFNNQIVGLVNGDIRIRGRDKMATLFNFYISKDYRSRGLGSMLFDYTLKFLKTNGCISVRGFVMNNNKKALNFWTKEKKFKAIKGYNISKNL